MTPKPKPKEAAPEQLKSLRIKVPLTVKELAVKLTAKPNELIKRMMKLKIMATINQLLDEETIKKVQASP